MKNYCLGLISLLLLTPINNVKLNSNELAISTQAIQKESIFDDFTKEEIKTYYSSLNDDDGLKGEGLLIKLQEIIEEGHTKIENSLAWKTNRELFLLIDRNYELDPLSEEEKSTQKWKLDNVIVNPLYTDDYTWKQGNNKNFDREHMWPKSRGFKDKYSVDEDLKEQPFAATDMHNLRIGERTNNQQGHNNRPYGEILDLNASTTVEVVDSVTNKVTGHYGLNKDGYTVYEPRDEDKGDIARSLFYMATRYHSYRSTEDFEPALKLVSTFNTNPEETLTCDSTKTTPATYGILDDLLSWNKIDPVDNYEKHRNNLVYNAVQHNRNPFIDYPEWADVCFKDTSYGINLDSDIGVEKEGFYVSLINSNYELNETLEFKDFTFTYINQDNKETIIQNNDPNINLEISLNSKVIENIKPISNYSTLTFNNPGEYLFTFTYTNENNKEYTTTYTISIEDKSPLEIFFDKYGTYIIIGIAILFVIIILISIFTGKKIRKRKKYKYKKKRK